MHIILVAPKSGQPMSLFYRTKDTADIAYKNAYEFQKGSDFPVLYATDDFGHIVTIARENFSHAILIDHEKAGQLGPPSGMGQRVPPASGIPAARNVPEKPLDALPPVEIIGV